VFKHIYGYAVLALTLLAAGTACAADAFPLAGHYTQNRLCKGDGSDPADARVHITQTEIESSVGLCTILSSKRDGNSIAANVECQIAGAPLVGDVTFTLRDTNTVDFVDRDNNYKAVLHRCPK
jgi:hypothetical protein